MQTATAAGILGDNPNKTVRTSFAANVCRTDFMMTVTLFGHVTVSKDKPDFAFKCIFSVPNVNIVNGVAIHGERPFEDNVVCLSIEGG
jgi:hypothetical protein